jgi:hypothetical protein
MAHRRRIQQLVYRCVIVGASVLAPLHTVNRIDRVSRRIVVWHLQSPHLKMIPDIVNTNPQPGWRPAKSPAIMIFMAGASAHRSALSA